MRRVIIVKYGEVYLRGDNKRIFINMLVKTIRERISCFDGVKTIKGSNRLFIEGADDEYMTDAVVCRLKTIMGISKISLAVCTDDVSMDSIRELSLGMMAERGGTCTFKVDTRRYNKSYPLDSQGISSDVGGYILENMPGMKVDVHDPQLTLNIELGHEVYIYAESIRGLGGLPYASTGRGMALLSGGIDSPVACFLMAKRGVEISGVYFHSPPYTPERTRDKVTDMAKRLSVYTGGFKLYIVNFTELQTLLHETVAGNRLTLLVKRSMLRIAEKLALRTQAACLITGDSIGQVASQTVLALAAMESAVTLPVIRPLAGMDKQEIVDVAKAIETYDISIRPYEDCCTLFAAQHPETKPKREVIERIERNVAGLTELAEKAADEAELVEL